MPNVSISTPEDLKQAMNHHHEVNWSAVIRSAIQDHLRKIAITEAIARKSKLTHKDIEDLGWLVK